MESGPRKLFYAVGVIVDWKPSLTDAIESSKRRKFTTSIQPAKAYENESVMLSGPH